MGNEIIFARRRDVGVLPPDVAGPTAPAAGAPGERRAMDPGKDEPYEKYGEVEFEVPVGQTGDSYDRLWVLVERMKQSCDIIEQCMTGCPPGTSSRPKLPKTLKLEGEVYVRTENPLGLMGYYLVGDGETALPAEDAHTVVLERERDPGDAARHAAARPHLDPGVDLLRGRRRRPLGRRAGDGASTSSASRPHGPGPARPRRGRPRAVPSRSGDRPVAARPSRDLDALRDAGLSGIQGPVSSAGGLGADHVAARPVFEAVAGGCGATAFVWAQHHGAVRRLAGCRRSRPRRLAAETVRRNGHGRHRLRVPAPARAARGARTRSDGGWRFDGEAPWITGWGLIDVLVLMGRADDGAV